MGLKCASFNRCKNHTIRNAADCFYSIIRLVEEDFVYCCYRDYKNHGICTKDLTNYEKRGILTPRTQEG